MPGDCTLNRTYRESGGEGLLLATPLHPVLHFPRCVFACRSEYPQQRRWVVQRVVLSRFQRLSSKGIANKEKVLNNVYAYVDIVIVGFTRSQCCYP